MKYRWIAPLILGLLSSPRATAAEVPEAPLKVVDTPLRSAALSTPSPGAEAPNVAWRLANVSDQTIVAWHFACFQGLSDGRELWIGRGADGVPRSADPSVQEAAADTPVEPGATITIEMPARPAPTGPYDVWTCGPTATVSADLTTWGSPAVLDRIFAERRARLDEAQRIVDSIVDLQRTAGSMERSQLVSLIENALPVTRWGTYRGEVAKATRGESTATILDNLSALELELRSELSTLRRHLRPGDLERVHEEGVR